MLTTVESGADEVIDETCGRVVPADKFDALVEGLRWFARQRDNIADFQRAARAKAEQCSWKNYRLTLTNAVRPYL